MMSIPAKMPLDAMSWRGIQKVAKSGKASEYWKVGDAKEIILNITGREVSVTCIRDERPCLTIVHSGIVSLYVSDGTTDLLTFLRKSAILDV